MAPTFGFERQLILLGRVNFYHQSLASHFSNLFWALMCSSNAQPLPFNGLGLDAMDAVYVKDTLKRGQVSGQKFDNER